MSIQIEVRATGLTLSAKLKDEALASIITLIQANRDESAPAALMLVPEASESELTAPTASNLGQDSMRTTKEWLQKHGAAELLNIIRWESYPEKILLLGAWCEARGGHCPWRSSDMDDVFKQAKEKAPANFPRDIRNAIKSGWVHAETPRTYAVTRTGWNKIGLSIEELDL